MDKIIQEKIEVLRKKFIDDINLLLDKEIEEKIKEPYKMTSLRAVSLNVEQMVLAEKLIRLMRELARDLNDLVEKSLNLMKELKEKESGKKE